MNRYPRLREETERIITTYIREKEQACKAGGGDHLTNPQFKAVLRIHDILGWIRIQILLFSYLTFKMPAKN
jgi:hypothetical protein